MRKKKQKEKKPRKKRSDARPPHDPRQRTVRDILLNRVRNGDVRAMIVLGVYYAYGIGGRKLHCYAARLFKDAYPLMDGPGAHYCTQSEVCGFAWKLLERSTWRSASRSFADEVTKEARIWEKIRKESERSAF